jgi:hypothetical protein
MTRWLWFCICTALAAVMLLLGWLTPIHLRALDVGVLQRAGRKTPGLIQRGLELASHNELGAAQLLSEAASQENVPERQRLARAVADSAARDPAAMVWGGAASTRLESLFRSDPRLPKSGAEALTEFVVRLENRDRVLDLLRDSSMPAVRELLQCRLMTNTAVFPPSTSAAGQAFDAAISICGLLIQEGDTTPSLRDWVLGQASKANRGGDSRPLEEALLDLLALGQRLNWGQVAVITAHVDDANALHLLAGVIRTAGRQLPVLYSSVDLSGKPGPVAAYVLNFSQTGLSDLAATLPYGTGAMDELLRRGQQVYISTWRQRATNLAPINTIYAAAVDYALRMPAVAMGFKWLCYFSGGFWLAMALHFARPARWDSEAPAPARGVRFGREMLFAMGSLVVVLLLSEPFLAQESQKMELPFRLHLPTLGSAAPAGIVRVSQSVMNPQSLLTLLLFFVLQALIYTACLVKLAEIRRQRTPARVKLKLLDNEEHLFDAGLYLGFAGTIVSLILVSLAIIRNPSLMAAYSSTAFGIIFVSIFKIFHLRPARRLLLLEAETLPDEPRAAVSEARILTHS